MINKTIGDVTKEELDKWLTKIRNKNRYAEIKKRIELLKIKMNNNG